MAGRVRAEDGAILAFITIYLVPRDTALTSQTALTDSAGAFEFTGLVAGDYYLRLDRPGYEPEWSDVKRLVPGRRMVLAVTSQAARVRVPRVLDGSLCRLATEIEDSTALGLLWREARRAASARRLFDLAYRYDVRIGETLRDPRNVYWKRKVSHSVTSTPALARELARSGGFAGYGVQMDSTRIVAVPELLQVLTERFARTHCLASLPDRYQEHRIRFEPFTALIDRAFSDFAGNIILDEKLALKRIEFEYRRGRSSDSRGIVEFGDGPVRRGPVRFVKSVVLMKFDAPITTTEWVEMDPRAYNARARVRATVDVRYGPAVRDTAP